MGYHQLSRRVNKVKNPRPEDVALICPIEGDLKSPFLKGGFRGILKAIPENPPRPPFSKGGRFMLKSTVLTFMLFTAKPIDSDPAQRTGFPRMK